MVVKKCLKFFVHGFLPLGIRNGFLITARLSEIKVGKELLTVRRKIGRRDGGRLKTHICGSGWTVALTGYSVAAQDIIL